jgi:hypothetical protein
MPTPDKTVIAYLRRKFSAADCQTLMAVLMGTTSPAAQLPELVAAVVGNPDSFVRTHFDRRVNGVKVLDVNFPALLKKLRNEKLCHLEVLQKYTKAACNIETDYLVDNDGVPCIHALRRVGLIAPTGPTAWGFAVVRTTNFGADQWVLRNDPTDVPTIQGSKEELSRQLVELTHRMRGGNAPADFNRRMLHRLYTMTRLTGWFNFRVEEDGSGRVRVVEIKTRALFDDICRNSRRDHRYHRENDPKMPAIQGVNAPLFAR